MKTRYVMMMVLCAGLLACSGAEVYEAPDLHLTDSQGQTIQLADLRGQWVVLNYWAAWCQPCIVEMPELEALHRNYRDVTVLGLNFDNWDDDKLNAFARDLLVSYPLLPAEQFAMLEVEPIAGLPTTYFIDPEGYLRGPLLGPQTDKELADFMGVTLVS